MSTHTPGPWKVKPYLTPELDEDPMMVYEVIAGDLQERFDNLPVDENEEQALDDIHAENEANAAFIVRACNSHEAMLEALKAILDHGRYDDAGNFVIDCESWDGQGNPPDTTDPLCIQAAWAAIRLAEGRG